MLAQETQKKKGLARRDIGDITQDFKILPSVNYFKELMIEDAKEHADKIKLELIRLVADTKDGRASFSTGSVLAPLTKSDLYRRARTHKYNLEITSRVAGQNTRSGKIEQSRTIISIEPSISIEAKDSFNWRGFFSGPLRALAALNELTPAGRRARTWVLIVGCVIGMGISITNAVLESDIQAENRVLVQENQALRKMMHEKDMALEYWNPYEERGALVDEGITR